MHFRNRQITRTEKASDGVHRLAGHLKPTKLSLTGPLRLQRLKGNQTVIAMIKSRDQFHKMHPHENQTGSLMLNLPQSGGIQLAAWAVSGTGFPLPKDLRADFELTFGRDFSDVRIYANSASARGANAINASAYAVGNKVAFAQGQYAPRTGSGRELLAHELAHVVQQMHSTGPIARGLKSESEAAGAARAAMSGQIAVLRTSASPLSVQRQPRQKNYPDPRKLEYSALLKAVEEMKRWLNDNPASSPERDEIELRVLPAYQTTLEHLSPGITGTPESRQDWEAVLKAGAEFPQFAPRKPLEPLSQLLPPPRTAFEAEAFRRNLRRIRDPKSNTIIGFFSEEDGVYIVYDIKGGKTVVGEKPLEAPAVDPIDLIPTELVGSLLKEAAITAGKTALKAAGKAAARDAGHESAEAATKLLVRESAEAGSKAAGGVGAEAIDARKVLAKRSIDEVQVDLLAGEASIDSAKSKAAGEVGSEVAAVGNAVTAVSKTPQAVATAIRNRYQGRLIDRSNQLEKIIERARNPALRAEGRAAANELRELMAALERNEIGGKRVVSVEIIAPTSRGRSPDLGVLLIDGTTTRIEARAITSAPRGYVAPLTGETGAIPRALARATEARTVTQSDIEQAILSKAKDTPARPSQLTAPLSGYAPGGTISLNITAADVAPETVNSAMTKIAPKLGSHVEIVQVSFLSPRPTPSSALPRSSLTYIRLADESYLRMP